MNRLVWLLGGASLAVVLLVGGSAVYLKQRQTMVLTQRPEHGIEFRIQIEPAPGPGTNDLRQLQLALLERSRRAGVRLFWEAVSASSARVVLEAPNPDELESLKSALFNRGWLELRLVHENNDQLLVNGDVPPGYEPIEHVIAPLRGPERNEKLIVKAIAEAGLAGSIIKQASVVRGPLGEAVIYFQLRPEATDAFARVTSQSLGRRLAIILDGKLCSAPTIQSAITSGNGQISGSFTTQEALRIANALDSPLPVAVQVVEARRY